MLKGLFQKLLNKSGKTYEIDSRIPDLLIFYTLSNRFFMLLRGILKTGRKVYVGKGARIYNSKNIVFGHSVTIGRLCEIDGFSSEKIVLGNCVKIGSFSTLTSTSHFSKYGKGLRMGDNSAIGDYTHFGASGGITIGDDVIMGSYISFHSENHNYGENGKLIREQGVSSKGIILGNNIWVGAKATFLDGCVVGNNSVVAAGAVVNGRFPDNVLIGGVPAKILKEI